MFNKLTTSGIPAKTRARTRLSMELLEDRATPAALSAITTSFPHHSFPDGNTAWFNSTGIIQGLKKGPATLHVTGQTIAYRSHGSWHTLDVSDTTVTFTVLATKATTTYSDESGWQVTAPPKFRGDFFLSGLAVALPDGAAAAISKVKWKGNFSSDTKGLRLEWRWAVAGYSRFGDSPNDYGIKTVDDRRVDHYRNRDNAGTPESYKEFALGDASKHGPAEYTGWNSRFARVRLPVDVPPPPPVSQGSLGGLLFVDFDGNGFLDGDDYGISGAEIDLTWQDANGKTVSKSYFTDSSGTFSFTGLDAGVYSIQTIPGNYTSHYPTVGTLGGTVDPTYSAITDITVKSGDVGTGYNFGYSDSST